MATDGVKIIDGDLAHDTYWSIMDLYDKGVDISTIKREMPFFRRDYGIDEDFYHEIYVTAYALAMWEIGALTEGILNQVRKVIDKRAGVKTWTAIEDAKAGNERQRELDRLWKKISQPNTKIRKRKKYRQITNFHFQPDNLLTFKLQDNHYRAVVCALINQHRGECAYTLAPTTYKSLEKPTVEALFNYDIIGIAIGAEDDTQNNIQKQPGVQELWHLFPYYGQFFFGLEQLDVLHEHFINFKDKFEKVGTLKLKDSFKRMGSLRVEGAFENFEQIFRDYENPKKILVHKRFPVKLLCDKQ